MTATVVMTSAAQSKKNSDGGEAAKPLLVWSSSVTFPDLYRPRPEALTESLVVKGVNGSFTERKMH